MPTSEKWFTPATKIAKEAEAVDELPPSDIQTHITTGDHVLFAEFQAFVQGSKITPKGELIIQLGIPYEYKYEAIALTDLRGTVFIVQAYKPLRPGEQTDEQTDDNSTAHNLGWVSDD